MNEVRVRRDEYPVHRGGGPLHKVGQSIIAFASGVADNGDRKVLLKEVHDHVLLFEELLQFLCTGIVCLDLTVGLVLAHRLVAVDRFAFEGEVDACWLELIDQRLELTEEVVHNRRRTHLESATCTMGLIHEVDCEDGHASTLSRLGLTIHSAMRARTSSNVVL